MNGRSKSANRHFLKNEHEKQMNKPELKVCPEAPFEKKRQV